MNCKDTFISPRCPALAKVKQLQGILWKGYLHTVLNVSTRNFPDIGKPGWYAEIRNTINYLFLYLFAMSQ